MNWLFVHMTHDITKKQQELLLLLYRFRFLNRVQIQTLLNHKTYNRVIVWLNDLVKKGYIGKIVHTGSEIQMRPTIYYIQKRGIQFLNTVSTCEKQYIARMYKEGDKSSDFIDRCVDIADIYIGLLKTYGSSPDFSFYTQSDYSVGSIIREIFPHFVYRRRETYYVGEFIKEKPRLAIRARIKRYISFYTSSETKSQALSSKFLLICPNETIEDYTIKFLRKTLEEESVDILKFHISTSEQVKLNCIEGKIWTGATDTD